MISNLSLVKSGLFKFAKFGTNLYQSLTVLSFRTRA